MKRYELHIVDQVFQNRKLKPLVDISKLTSFDYQLFVIIQSGMGKRKKQKKPSRVAPWNKIIITEVDYDEMTRLLEKGYSRTITARMMGFSRATLTRKMKEYEKRHNL